MDTLNKIHTTMIGTTGIVGTEIAPQILETASVSPQSWVQALTQVVIAVATLVGLFRKGKSVKH